MSVSVGPASSNRPGTEARTGSDPRRCTYAPPAALVVRVTAALTTGNVALSVSLVTPPSTVTNSPLSPASALQKGSTLLATDSKNGSRSFGFCCSVSSRGHLCSGTKICRLTEVQVCRKRSNNFTVHREI
ncbi:hypothetical protein AMECASPLE_017920 [Ameca splendens]|uniref:Uncharacterized protein n=1 Tax=Ameca splendens TaxID=208324 RepID=A0ABV0ZYB6_9TELE